MKDGKSICKQLKAIRKQIAEQNEIELHQEECTHEGNCLGTCPHCEQEVRYLEGEILKRQKMGKAVSIVGLAAGMSAAMSLSSCATAGLPANETLMGDVRESSDSVCLPDEAPSKVAAEGDSTARPGDVLMGKIYIPEDNVEE